MKLVSLQDYLSFMSFSEREDACGTGIFIVHTADKHPIKEFQVTNKEDHMKEWWKAMSFIWGHPYLG